MKRTLGILALILLVSIVITFPTLRNTLYTATGFSAKNICSGHFISGFSGDLVMTQALLPVSNSFTFVDFNIDTDNEQVTTDFFGFFNRKAVYSTGIGCTLLAPNDDGVIHKVVKLADAAEKNQSPWPNGNGAVNLELAINYQQLKRSLAQAFKEPDELANRRTKAVVVIHKGQLIAENYAAGVNQHTPLLSWSMAKSITNMQVGLLVKDGLLNINQQALVPQWQEFAGDYHKITLDHLLRMSSGLDFSEVYAVGGDAAMMLSVEPGAAEFAADKPIAYQADSHWSYSSGTSNIISGIIKRSIGGNFQRYYEFTQKRLFLPLGIESAQLEADANGTFIGSSYMYATARDWAKLGQLMLQDGIWKGLRILPKGWVKYSITPTKTDPLNHYGAHFWLNRDPDSKNTQRKWPSVPTDAYYMSGFQGQSVIIIPSHELVIVRLGYTTPGADKGIEALIAGVIKSLQKKEI